MGTWWIGGSLTWGVPVPEYKTPGVYVEEVERGPKPIEGVSTSVAGFLGGTDRGPEEPRLITSFADYRRLYGGVVDDSNLAHAVKGFFDNGGSRCYIGRVTRFEEVADGGAAGHAPQGDTLDISTNTIDYGFVEDGETVTRSVVVTNLGDPAAGDPTAADPAVEISGLSVSSTDDDEDQFEPADLPSTNGGSKVSLAPGASYVVEVDYTADPGTGPTKNREATLEISHNAGTPSSPIEVDLLGSGVTSGDEHLAVSAGWIDFGTVPVNNERTESVTLSNLGASGDSPIDVSDISTTDDAFEVTPMVDSDAGDSPETIEPGESLELEVTAAPDDALSATGALELVHDATSPSATTASPTSIGLAVEGAERVLAATTVGPGPWGEGVALVVEDATMYKPGRNEFFALTVRYWADPADRAEAKAVYAEPDRDSDEAPDPDVEEVYDNLSPEPAADNYYVEEVSGASTLVDLDKEADGRPANGISWLVHEKGGDVPDEVDVTHYEGDAIEVEDRTGLAAFEQVDEITIVCAPDENAVGQALTLAIENHCASKGDRFAILQAEEDADPPGSLTPSVDSSYAAFYHPWLTVSHAETGNEITVPPGGHVAGIFARSDSEHGVHKAPANEVVRGVLSLPVTIGKADQATLNPRGVNCIRSFRGRGIRLWGARTTSSDPAWKYVNVRRLFLYIEESIDEGTQWVVFESNDEDLWARVRQTISNFLTGVWEDGALMGTTPDEAFYVKCDRSTMTQNDIDNGRLICEIGIAPVKPAEFVVFRISQWTAGAEGGG